MGGHASGTWYCEAEVISSWEKTQIQLEKDRGNPGVLKVYPYPHPLKTPTLVKGRGF